MKKLIFLPMILIITVLIGCIRPYPVYDLIPSGDYNTRWLFGSEYVIISDNNLVTSLAYINSEKDLLIFDLEVINRSGSDVLVAPEKFYYHPIEAKFVSDTLKVMAVDPELKLKMLDKLISHKRADLSNQAISNFVVETADLIGDIADSEDRNIQEKQLDANKDLERQVSADREEGRTRNQISDLSSQRNYWASQVLRKTTLKPGEAIHGKIYFPADRDTEKLKIILTLENVKFDLIFDQSRF
jgi:hypothetical protein